MSDEPEIALANCFRCGGPGAKVHDSWYEDRCGHDVEEFKYGCNGCEIFSEYENYWNQRPDWFQQLQLLILALDSDPFHICKCGINSPEGCCNVCLLLKLKDEMRGVDE